VAQLAIWRQKSENVERFLSWAPVLVGSIFTFPYEYERGCTWDDLM
jgi:hypothetical protein